MSTLHLVSIDKGIKLLWVLLLLCINNSAFSQSGRGCGTEEWIDKKIETEPSIERFYSESFRNFNQNINKRNLGDAKCPYVIAVHVIIIHPPGEEIDQGSNISYERILSQIKVLNEDYGRTNADATDTPAEFSAGSTGINFCLARIDPDGNPTNGVTRYATDEVYDFGVDGIIYDTRIRIKQETGWDKEKYLNIWVAPTIDGGSNIIGFSRVPSIFSHPNPEDDGISILTDVFGGPGFSFATPYNLGRTTTHELGHYLGLLHIATKRNSCTGDDGISDTPRQFEQNFGCPSHPKISCGNTGEMFMNYMDYTDDSCMNAFSVEQGNYMRAVLENLRKGLISHAPIACPNELKIEISVIDQGGNDCNDGQMGFVTVEACKGNDDNYRYAVGGSDYTSIPTLSGLEIGDHLISVINDLGVVTDTLITIGGPEAISSEVISIDHVSCFGVDNGTFSISASGGNGNFLYKLSNGNFTETNSFSGLGPGTYTVEIIDSKNCSHSRNVTVTSPSELNLNTSLIAEVSCNGGNDGGIVLAGTGGILPYEYSIDGISYFSESSITNLSAGTYPFWVRDANGCEVSSSFSIVQPEELSVFIEIRNSISCPGQTDGELSFSSTGGTGTYTYWLDGTKLNSSNVTNLGSGTYKVEVTDNNMCIGEKMITLEDPTPMVIEQINIVDVLCAGDETGSIQLIVSGGREPYSYYLNGQEGNGGIFEGLGENLYTILILDSEGCQSSSEEVIITNGNLKVNQISRLMPTCSYSSDGVINVEGSGGTGVFTYSIDGVTFQEDGQFMGLPSGVYIVYASDGVECLASTVVDLRAPEAVKLSSLSTSGVSCFGAEDGFLGFEISGGSGIYNYYVNGNPISNDFLDKLNAGGYILEAVDDKGCKYDTLINITTPPEINISLLDISPVICSGSSLGSISVQANGGVGVFNYTIDGNSNNTGNFSDLDNGTYSIVVTDESFCTAEMTLEVPLIGGLNITIDELIYPTCADNQVGEVSISTTGGASPYQYHLDGNIQDNGDFYDLPPGAHAITIVDNAFCSEEIIIEILPAEEIVLNTLAPKMPSCHDSEDGILRIEAQGTIEPYSYTLGGITNRSGVFLGLKKGIYEVSVVDANLCSSTFEVELEGPVRVFSEILEVESPSCHGSADGNIYLKTAGGQGVTSISLNDLTTNEEIFVDQLEAGTYRFILSDENNCTSRIDIFIDQPQELVVEDTIISMANYNSGGSIELIMEGGTQPYQYALDGSTFQSESIFENLEEGNYEIEIEDANGCMTSVSLVLEYDDIIENPPGTISEVLVGLERIKNETIVSFIAHGEQEIKFYIFNSGGKYVGYAQDFTLDGPNKMTIPASNLPAGIYIVWIEAEREVEIRKFIKL